MVAFAEYQTLDRQSQRALWQRLSDEERQALKAEGLAARKGAGPADPLAASPEAPAPTTAAADAVAQISQSLGASVGRHLRQQLDEAARTSGTSPDEIMQRLMAGADPEDVGLEDTGTLRAILVRLRGRGAPRPRQAAPQPAPPQQAAPMPSMPEMPQQPEQGLLDLMGGA